MNKLLLPFCIPTTPIILTATNIDIEVSRHWL